MTNNLKALKYYQVFGNILPRGMDVTSELHRLLCCEDGRIFASKTTLDDSSLQIVLIGSGESFTTGGCSCSYCCLCCWLMNQQQWSSSCCCRFAAAASILWFNIIIAIMKKISYVVFVYHLSLRARTKQIVTFFFYHNYYSSSSIFYVLIQNKQNDRDQFFTHYHQHC